MNKSKNDSLAFKPLTVGILWLIGILFLAFVVSVVGLTIGMFLFIHGGFLFIIAYLYLATGRWLDWEAPWEYHARVLSENGVHRTHHRYDHEADVYNSGRQTRDEYYRD